VTSQALPRSQRLRSRKDYTRIQAAGRRSASHHFVVLVGEQHPASSDTPARLGVTVSRRVGSAVARNRVKRRIRECFRAHCALPRGRDIVVIARRGAAELSTMDAARELDPLLAGDSR
jgi:ribonuclease P protein component